MNRQLKVSVLFFLVFINIFSVTAQDLIKHEFKQDWKMHDLDKVITSPSVIWLYLTNENIEGEWYAEVLTKDNVYEDISSVFILDDHPDRCAIDPINVIDPIKNTSWRNAKKIFDETLNRDLFEIKVTFTADDGSSDSVTLMWALIPSRPRIRDVEFTYEYDWEWDEIYPNGIFSFIVESEDADLYTLHISESFLYEPPGFFSWCMNTDASPEGTLISYDADWGEYLVLVAINRFGSSVADVFCTTSYIHDQTILDRINEIKNNSSVEIHPDSDASFFSWDGKTLNFIDRADKISLYSITGKLIGTWEYTDSIDLSDYPNDIYIVSYWYNSNNYNNKIIKR